MTAHATGTFIRPSLLVALICAPSVLSLPLNAQASLMAPLDAAVLRHLAGPKIPAESPIPANLVIEDVGGNFRIASAGKLRMLSQRIAAAACNYAAGINPEKMLDVFVKAKAEYAQILNALVNGDESMGIIGPESRRKTLEEIERVNALWLPFEAALDGIVAGKDVAANVAYIAANNEALLQEANLLTSEVSGEYANPAEMTQAAAMLVDISARQRMLTQKIAKEACGVATGNAALGDPERLAKTIALYETSLGALINGMPDAGIIAPPTDEIRAALEAAAASWQVTKAEVAKVTGAGSVSPEQQAAIFDMLEGELAGAINIAKLYTEHAKTKI